MVDTLTMAISADAVVTKPNIVFLYHRDCNDGFCAAWMARKKFPDAAFISVARDEPVPEIRGKNAVYILDYSFDQDDLGWLCDNNGAVIVLDHHKSAFEKLDGFNYPGLTMIFDLNKSGARITQEYFGLPSNWLVDYTEDYDLWRHRLEDSKAINAYLQNEKRDFAIWDQLENLSLTDITIIGQHYLALRDAMVNDHCNRATMITVAGHKVPAVSTTVFRSDIGAVLAMGAPFAVCYSLAGEIVTCSLRSTPEGLDVSNIAIQFGGGGHRHAASFRVGLDEWRSFIKPT